MKNLDYINSRISTKIRKLNDTDIVKNIVKTRREVIDNFDDTDPQDLLSVIQSKEWYISLSQRKKSLIDSLLLEKLKKDNFLLCQREVSSQRKEADSSDLEKSWHLDKSIAKQKLNSIPKRRFYLYQLIFSNYLDYYYLPDDNISNSLENSYIDLIVIDPNNLNNEFLLKILWSNSEFSKLIQAYNNASRLVEKESIKYSINKIKLDLIPYIKELIKSAYPINLSKWASARACIIDKEADISDGKIFLVSAANYYDEFNKRKPNYKNSLHIYDDIYSFIRSQYYTLSSIKDQKDEIAFLSNDAFELISGLTISSRDFDNFSQNLYFSVLSNLKNYNLWFAFDSLEKLISSKWKNPLIDYSRFKWLSNKLKDRINVLNWQETSILLKLRESLELVSRPLNITLNIHKNFKDNLISNFDDSALKSSIEENDNDALLEFWDTNFSMIKDFKKNLSVNLDLLENKLLIQPFKSFIYSIKDLEKYLWKIMNKDEVSPDDVLGFLRRVYHFQIEIKRQKFVLFMYWFHNSLKIDKNRKAWLYSSNKNDKEIRIKFLNEKVDQIISLLSFELLIPSFNPTNKVIAEFDYKYKILYDIKKFLEIDNMDYLLDFLESKL